jgi:ketosteroid isomerase-like protein
VSRENVALVRELADSFAKRDHERAFAIYDPDIEWDASRGIRSAGGEMVDELTGVYHGHEGVRNWWRRWLEAWKDIEFEVQDVLDAGDEVVLLIRTQRQWGRHSGIATEVAPYAMVFTFRGGKVVRWRNFPDQKAALKAVGLSE